MRITQQRLSGESILRPLTDWSAPASLLALDGQGYAVLEAITTAPLRPSASHSKPNAFVCVDGKTYWVKGQVQQGLVAELVAGRLAVRIGAGSVARVIRVTPSALPADGSASHLEGVVVGSENVEGVVNARELGPLLAGAQFPAGSIDAASRARVVVFHSWLGMRDAQVLVHLTTGKIMSIDHGDCFGDVGHPRSPPTPVVADIPGADADHGREAVHVLDAVARIEAVADNDILRAIAQIPIGDDWRSPTDRRLAIGRYLAERRDNLRGVMQAWMKP